MWPSIDHSILSPSGHMSKRARKAARERVRVELFGADGLKPLPAPQPTETETLTRQIAQLEDLASRGMSPRKFRKEAAKLRGQLMGTRERPTAQGKTGRE